MMYPFLTLNDQTETVHSEWLPTEQVRVYIEKPAAKDGFHHGTCMLPGYHWQDVDGFTPEKIVP